MHRPPPLSLILHRILLKIDFSIMDLSVKVIIVIEVLISARYVCRTTVVKILAWMLLLSIAERRC